MLLFTFYKILDDFRIQFKETDCNALEDIWPHFKTVLENLQCPKSKTFENYPVETQGFLYLIENIRDFNNKTFEETIKSFIEYTYVRIKIKCLFFLIVVFI